jgi:hypothetical protein
MRPLVFTGLGIGFILMGAALYALTLRKPKSPPAAMPNKSQLREMANLDEENRKMRLASGVIAGIGALLILLTFI